MTKIVNELIRAGFTRKEIETVLVYLRQIEREDKVKCNGK